MFDPVIAPSGTLLGLLQRGRGDGTLHALTAPRAEALAALNHCVLHDPATTGRSRTAPSTTPASTSTSTASWTRSRPTSSIPRTSSRPTSHAPGWPSPSSGTLASYGRLDALQLLRRYAANGVNWAWALDELALRDDDSGLRSLAAPVLARFPHDAEGDAELAVAVRDAFEPRPWRLWADDPRESIATRVRAAHETGCFDRWQRQMSPTGPRPGWSVRAVFEWAQQGVERGAALHVPAARCLTAVAGPEDRPEIVEAARSGDEGARCTALRYLADGNDPDALDLIEGAVTNGSTPVVEAAVAAFERMRSLAAVDLARRWVHRPDAPGRRRRAGTRLPGRSPGPRPRPRRTA